MPGETLKGGFMASPLYSAGARYERAAVRAYLERKLRSASITEETFFVYESVLKWIKSRQSRYDKRPGGL